MVCKIYLPTIHLFAYSRKSKSDNLLENVENNNSEWQYWLWEQCNKIIQTKLGHELTQEFDLKYFLQEENPKLPAENLLKQKLPVENKLDFIDITVSKRIDSYYIDDYFPVSIKEEDYTKADIYALKLYNSYALGLNFYPKLQLRQKKFSLEQIKQHYLNSDNCLVLSQDNNEPFLGQTILISAKVTGKIRNRSSEWLKNNIADQYLEALFPEKGIFRKPAFNRAGKLFGRPIFEYGISRQLDNYIHVLVWLINDKDEKNILERSYGKLLDLFFFRAKVIHAYKETRRHSKVAKNKNLRIESKLEGMVGGSSITKEIENLNLTEIYQDLVELTQMSVRYANVLRDIEEHQNSILDNTRNYTDKIREIKSVFPGESLGFLSFFGERTCRSFIEQVAGELGYFQHGIDLVDNVVDALRGQIAIEQTNRERELQSTILGLGFGMTAAGNFASSYEAGSNADEHKIKLPLPFFKETELRLDLYHFSASLIISFLIGFIIWLLSSRYFRRKYEKKQLVTQKQNKSK